MIWASLSTLHLLPSPSLCKHSTELVRVFYWPQVVSKQHLAHGSKEESLWKRLREEGGLQASLASKRCNFGSKSGRN